MKEMRESLLIIKMIDNQTEMKQFKSFRFTKVKADFTRVETKSSLGLNFW